MIHVTKTYLPPLEEYVQYLQRIWKSNQLTNNGPLVRELESKVKEHLRVKDLFFVSSGTIALQIAIKALDLEGDIITTPFSYVATTSSIVWEGCRPVFVDIDPETLCLNPALIDKAITPQTTAILATHVYGHPCDTQGIEKIAGRRGLKVIYDAAHAFGVRYKGVSLVSYGDVSTLSFHATKLFHTGEGGAVVSNDDAVAHKIAYMRNFGHRGQEAFWGLGINGKNSEFHAAMGLCVLHRVPELIRKRRAISRMYDELLRDSGLLRPRVLPGTTYNYAYYPVLFPSETELLSTRAALNERGIFPRRYFYPSLNTIHYAGGQDMPVAESAARRVLCLPLYDSMDATTVQLICSTVQTARSTVSLVR